MSALWIKFKRNEENNVLHVDDLMLRSREFLFISMLINIEVKLNLYANNKREKNGMKKYVSEIFAGSIHEVHTHTQSEMKWRKWKKEARSVALCSRQQTNEMKKSVNVMEMSSDDESRVATRHKHKRGHKNQQFNTHNIGKH